MNTLNRIKNLNKNFEKLMLEQTSKNMFSNTKGILENFNNFITNNKVILYGLAGIALSTSVGKSLSHLVEGEQIHYDSSLSQDINQTNMIKNKNYNDNLPELTTDTVNTVMNLKEAKTFKNPFWENNVVTISPSINSLPNYGENFDLKTKEHFDVNINNSLYLIDHDTNTITWNNDIVNEQKENMKHPNLYIEQIIYHEAAHAAFTQVSKYTENHKNTQQREMEADVASMLLIGVKYKSLETFNNVIDDGIQLRSYVFKADSNHNSVYALLELKQLVNNNPEILKLKVNDIAYFSNQIVSQIMNKNFDLTPQVENFKNSILSSNEQIKLDIKKENVNVIQYLSDALLSEKKTNISVDKLKTFSDARLDKFSNMLKNSLEKTNQNTYSALVYYKNDMNFDKTINELNNYIQTNSKIDTQLIQDIKKRSIENEFEFDFSKIKDIHLKQIAEKTNNQLKSKLTL